jgi:HK97 family phage prohead protease
MSLLLPEKKELLRVERSLQRLNVQAAEGLEESQSGVLTVAGDLVTYGTVNQNGWLWVPGALTESLAAKNDRNPLVMGYQHDAWEPLCVIGLWDIAQTVESKEGVHSVGRISDTQDGRDAATLVGDGAITGISVGFYPLVYQFVEPGEIVSYDTPFGKFTYEIEEWAIVVVQAEVAEASLVAVPADFDSRIDAFVQATMGKAAVALPGVAVDASWEDTAYSMARLMGGRGAAAFADLPELQHRALHARLSAGYRRHGKTPPPYERAPQYDHVAFQHDERVIFADRYLRKNLDAVIAGAGGLDGPLSAETCEKAERAQQALAALTRPNSPVTTAELEALTGQLRQTSETAKGLTHAS